MNPRIKQLAGQAKFMAEETINKKISKNAELDAFAEKFAELIVQECLNKIETHRIPVGNSAAGEMACEWTYAALKEIRDEIKLHFGVKL